MTWFKLDDNFPDNPKVIAAVEAAGLGVIGLFVSSGCYCSRQETDGRFPKSMAARFGGTKRLVEALVTSGLWHDFGDEYEIHDFLEYNPSKADLDSKRKAKSMAGAMGAAKRWASHSHDTPNAPDPTRPKDQEHSSSPKAEPYREDFDRWWAEYPRKEGKQKARAKYAARRRDGVDAERLLTAVQNYARTVQGTERQFIKQPATFLEGKEGPWSEIMAAVGWSPALDADERNDEPRRCPTCANTGHHFVNGEMVRCTHAALRSA